MFFVQRFYEGEIFELFKHWRRRAEGLKDERVLSQYLYFCTSKKVLLYFVTKVQLLTQKALVGATATGGRERATDTRDCGGKVSKLTREMPSFSFFFRIGKVSKLTRNMAAGRKLY